MYNMYNNTIILPPSIHKGPHLLSSKWISLVSLYLDISNYISPSLYIVSISTVSISYPKKSIRDALELPNRAILSYLKKRLVPIFHGYHNQHHQMHQGTWKQEFYQHPILPILVVEGSIILYKLLQSFIFKLSFPSVFSLMYWKLEGCFQHGAMSKTLSKSIRWYIW